MTISREPWMIAAACRGSDPRIWFPQRGESCAYAKAMCAKCPVAEQCLAYAFREHIYNGVFGGLSERQRRRMRQDARRVA